MTDAEAAEHYTAVTLDEFLSVIAAAPDGGHLLWRRLVDQIFYDAAHYDRSGDMTNAVELLEIARQAIARGHGA